MEETCLWKCLMLLKAICWGMMFRLWPPCVWSLQLLFLRSTRRPQSATSSWAVDLGTVVKWKTEMIRLRRNTECVFQLEPSANFIPLNDDIYQLHGQKDCVSIVLFSFNSIHQYLSSLPPNRKHTFTSFCQEGRDTHVLLLQPSILSTWFKFS